MAVKPVLEVTSSKQPLGIKGQYVVHLDSKLTCINQSPAFKDHAYSIQWLAV